MASDGSLQGLLDELDAALRDGRPARWIDENGNGMDLSGLSPDRARREALALRAEVIERMAGRPTPASVLGDAVRELNENGWPPLPSDQGGTT